MTNKKSASKKVTNTEKEQNARSGYCATAFFACASDIPAVVTEALPDGVYCTLDEMLKAMRRVEKQLLALSPTAGKHFVMVQVDDARDLILTLVMADTRIGLDKELDTTPAIKGNHTELLKTVSAIKKILGEAQSGKASFEDVRDELDKLPNPALTSTVLSLMDKKTQIVQSLAGPIDFSVGKFAVKEVASRRDQLLLCSISGGYEDQTDTVILEVADLKNADSRLFNVGQKVQTRVLQEEHRVNLLLAQLAKVHVMVTLSVPRIPITLTGSPGSILKTDLINLDLLEQQESLANIKTALIQQLKLDI
jgi:hypothetical protein